MLLCMVMTTRGKSLLCLVTASGGKLPSQIIFKGMDDKVRSISDYQNGLKNQLRFKFEKKRIWKPQNFDFFAELFGALHFLLESWR